MTVGLSAGTLDALLESIRRGIPWRPTRTDDPILGYFDLRAHVDGHAYFPDFPEQKDAIWQALRVEIIQEHIRRRPGSRPLSWWNEAKEQRDWNRGETEQLEAMSALTREELKILTRFAVVPAQRRPGAGSNCAECWEAVRAKARELDFDLDRAMELSEPAYIPEELVFPCAHVLQSPNPCSLFQISEPYFLRAPDQPGG